MSIFYLPDIHPQISSRISIRCYIIIPPKIFLGIPYKILFEISLNSPGFPLNRNFPGMPSEILTSIPPGFFIHTDGIHSGILLIVSSRDFFRKNPSRILPGIFSGVYEEFFSGFRLRFFPVFLARSFTDSITRFHQESLQVPSGISLGSWNSSMGFSWNSSMGFFQHFSGSSLDFFKDSPMILSRIPPGIPLRIPHGMLAGIFSRIYL